MINICNYLFISILIFYQVFLKIIKYKKTPQKEAFYIKPGFYYKS